MGSDGESMSHAFDFAEATVKRLDPDRVEICWGSGGSPSPAAIYMGGWRNPWVKVAGPEQMGDGCITIDGLDPDVPAYFKLVAANGSCLVMAERRVRLEGAVNFRDIGGYPTTDGRFVRWGRVFRSDGLSRLKQKDVERLGRLGLSYVFDFRTPAEAAAAPNRLPETPPVKYIHLPVSHGEFDFVEALKRIKTGDTSWLTPDFMVDGYVANLEYYGKTWGRVVRHLAGETEGATVFHCTGGKDRTGTCAALILLALGVPEEKVIADHQLSNTYIAELLPQINEMIAACGVDPEAISPYLMAPRECILALIDRLNSQYGSAAAYLQAKAGVDEDILHGLKRNLLDPECP